MTILMNHNWADLFTHASFFAVRKEQTLDSELQELRSKLAIDPNVENYHPHRKSEYTLGRLCTAKAYEACMGESLLSLPGNKDRSPQWPESVVGAISHNHFWVGSAVAKKEILAGIGIDFEVVGRTRPELSSYIRTPADLKKHPELSEEELLTFIFSSKESLYKALYPIVKKFFGFEDAALTELDVKNGLFTIELLSELSEEFGSRGRHIFNGRFRIQDKTSLTVLEIPH